MPMNLYADNCDQPVFLFSGLARFLRVPMASEQGPSNGLTCAGLQIAFSGVSFRI